ncbi:hypothetical protein [Frigidibacter oleivorans]|uniref:hypothetical protein n=1 Tax=Frigidibacter oleivorans TaxID=2487129 RepID=UPI000F8CFE48|nr:hypothetical protein [Frigidibacter oleivorans]
MTQKSRPMPGTGGSFTRKADGTLVPRRADPEPAAPSETLAPPVLEPVQDKPAGKPAKQPVKDA